MSVDKLPVGVTGFWGRRDTPPPQIDLKDWKRHLYAACALAGYSVQSPPSEPSWTYNNYLAARIVRYSKSIVVLVNSHYPIVAFAESADPPLEFVVETTLGRQLSAAGRWTVLDSIAANSAPTDEILERLTPAELYEIRHWKPSRVGDIVFNTWD